MEVGVLGPHSSASTLGSSQRLTATIPHCVLPASRLGHRVDVSESDVEGTVSGEGVGLMWKALFVSGEEMLWETGPYPCGPGVWDGEVYTSTLWQHRGLMLCLW